MIDKQIGAAAAAAEIAAYEEKHYGIIAPGYKETEQQTIEAIILKHCPSDKEAGKLVEAVIKFQTLMEKGDAYTQEQRWKFVCQEMYAALAEYEELNK